MIKWIIRNGKYKKKQMKKSKTKVCTRIMPQAL